MDGGRTFEDTHPDVSSVLTVPPPKANSFIGFILRPGLGILIVIVIVIVIAIVIVIGNLETDLAVPEQTMVPRTNTKSATPFSGIAGS